MPDLAGLNLAAVDGELAAQIDLLDDALRAEALERGIIDVRDLVGRGDASSFGRIDDDDVGVAARCEDTLARERAVELCRVFGQNLSHLLRRDAALGHALGVEQDAARLHAGQAAGDLREVALSGVLLRQGEAAMVGGDGLDRAVGQRGPEGLLIGLFAQRRCADEAGRVGIVRLVIAAVVEQEVVRAGLDVDLLAARSCGGDLGKRLLRAQVDDHDRHVRDLGDAQQMRHGLGLERIRAAARMRRRPNVARGLVLLDERVDHARVLAVDAGPPYFLSSSRA